MSWLTRRTSGGAAPRLGRLRTPAIAGGLVALLLVVAHFAIVPLVVPWLAERALAQFAASVPGRTARFDAASFDPVTLTLTIVNLSGAEPASRITYSAERLVVDFAARTLVQTRPALDSLTVAAPAIEVDLSGGGALDAFGALRRAAERVSVAELVVTNGILSASRPSEADARSWRVEGLDAHVQIEPGAHPRFTIAAGDVLGAAVAADGTIDGARATGKVQARNVDLGRFAQRLGFAVQAAAGTLEAAADFAIAPDGSTYVLHLGDGRVRALDAAVVPELLVTLAAPMLEGRFDAAVPFASSAVVRGALELTSGALALVDRRVEPPAHLRFRGGHIAFDGRARTLNVGGHVESGGTVEHSSAAPADESGSVTRYADVPAAALETYALLALGAPAIGGTIDAEVVLDDGAGRASVVARDLELDAPAPESIAMGLALLEDSAGTIALEWPIARSAGQPVPAAVAASLRARLESLAADPHAQLGALVENRGDALRAVEFAPGAAGFSPIGSESVEALGSALAQRPHLGVALAGAYDPELDRRALAARQVELHVSLATAGRSELLPPGPSAELDQIDFASALVQDVLAEFAGERLPAEEVATLRSLFDLRSATGPESPARIAYYRAVFEALVAQETIADAALERLGRYRARTVADALAAHGVERARIALTDPEPVAGDASVRLPVALAPLAEASEPVQSAGEAPPSR